MPPGPCDTPRQQNHVPAADGVVDPEASKLLAASLRGVANDPSTQPLSAHLCSFVASEVNASLRCLPRLEATMRLLAASASGRLMPGTASVVRFACFAGSKPPPVSPREPRPPLAPVQRCSGRGKKARPRALPAPPACDSSPGLER